MHATASTHLRRVVGRRSSVGDAALTVHPCALSAWSTNLLPTYLYCLPTYLPTHTYTHPSLFAEPRPASIAPICITRTCLSIALLPTRRASPHLAFPLLVSPLLASPRPLPSRTAKGETKKPPPPLFSTPMSMRNARDPATLPCHVAPRSHYVYTGVATTPAPTPAPGVATPTAGRTLHRNI